MSAQRKARRVLVNGKSYVYTDHVMFETMADAGWVLVTSIGSENLYFSFKTDTGEELDGYCKCL